MYRSRNRRLAAIAITFVLYDRSPIFVFRYIASGLMGSSAFSGGLLSAFIGLLCHFFIASAWTILFFILHRTVSRMLPHWILKGFVYGIIIRTIMNLIVLPLSQVPGGTPGIKQIVIGVTALILAAGIPMAYRFDQYYFKK